MELCTWTNNTNCPTAVDLSYQTDIFCCNYVLNNPDNLSNQLSQQGLFDAITLVRDLNIASMVSDYVFIIIAICVFCGLNAGTSFDFTNVKTGTLLVTALGSLIDVCITFSIVGIIDQNDLVSGMEDLYFNACYSDSLDRTILDLENQFQTVLILDVVEGALDIISLLILASGAYFRCIEKWAEFSSCTEGIHTFMFVVFDLIIISTNVFVFVLPSYDLFEQSYNDQNQLCFINVWVPTMSPTPSPTMDPTTSPTMDPTTLSPTMDPTTLSPTIIMNETNSNAPTMHTSITTLETVMDASSSVCNGGWAKCTPGNLL